MMMMIQAVFANRWRPQEWLLVIAVQLALIGVIDASGGDLPWWGNCLVALGVCLVIDIAEVLGRRREAAAHAYAPWMDK